MKKNKYLTEVAKQLKVSKKYKDRILFDIEMEINDKYSNSSYDEIVENKGEASKVAEEFNTVYKNTAVEKGYYKERNMKIFITVLAILALVLFVTSIVVGVSNFDSVIDGGNDGPLMILEPENFVLKNTISIALAIVGFVSMVAGMVLIVVLRKKVSKFIGKLQTAVLLFLQSF